jgi:small subunit ribosomal protein S4
MNVRQFRNYVRKARKTNAVFLQFFRSLETRIDTLVFRLNLAKTAGEARQLVNHRNFLINGNSVGFSSESINMFDVFSVKDKSFFYKKSVELFRRNFILFSLPSYLEVNLRIMSAVIFMWPQSSKVPYTRKIDARALVSGGPKDGR